jgi:hypothetical protein
MKMKIHKYSLLYVAGLIKSAAYLFFILNFLFFDLRVIANPVR